MPSSFDRLIGKRPVNDPRIIPFPKMAGYEKLRSPEEKASFLLKFDEQADRWRKSIIIPEPEDGDAQQVAVNQIVNDMMKAHTGHILTNAPLTGGGPTDVSVTLGITKADETTNGYLSAEDWLIFNAKLSVPINDDVALLKNVTNETKTARFDLTALTEDMLRVISIPDSDMTMAGIDIAQTFTQDQQFDGNVSFGGTAASIDSSGNYLGPYVDVEQALTVLTRNGEEASVVFHVFNEDTTDDSFFVKGGGDFFAAGTATIGGDISFPEAAGSMIGIASTELLAFWGATPVAQQVLATGAGATVDNVITLLQLIGLARQA